MYMFIIANRSQFVNNERNPTQKNVSFTIHRPEKLCKVANASGCGEDAQNVWKMLKMVKLSMTRGHGWEKYTTELGKIEEADVDYPEFDRKAEIMVVKPSETEYNI